MKRFLPILLLFCCTAMAQTGNSTFDEAVQAFKSGDYATSRTLFESVLAADPSNRGAQTYLAIIAKKGTAGLEASLREIILPNVELNDSEAREAFTFVQTQIKKQTAGKQNLNIVWMVPEGSTPPVSLSLQKIPATEALRYIADSAGLELKYEPHALKIQPGSKPAVQ